MTETTSEYTSQSVLTQLNGSKWSKFSNELHSRSFSLNILQMNAVALIEAALHASDPDRGIAMMQELNREARQQAHRELSRHLHNFTASAMTLVEHTRVFMRKNYKGTAVLLEYERQASGSFKDDPVSQFVQGLRNYMVHRGLPDSQMFFHLEQDEGGHANVKTGIRIEAQSLLDWSEWNTAAKKYISSVGVHLDIRSFAEEYLTRVNRFHTWLEGVLRRYHADDLTEFSSLQALHQTLLNTEKLSRSDGVSPQVEHGQAAPKISQRDMKAAALQAVSNEASETVQSKIRPISFRKYESDFPSQRHSSATVTDQDIIGPVVFWGPDANGIPTLSYIIRGTETFGIREADYDHVERLFDAILGLPWARDMFSRKFLEDEFLIWSRAKFLDSAVGDFADALLNAADEKIRRLEAWLPIAHLEVEGAFDFGPIKIAPITEAMMNDLEAKAVIASPENAERIPEFFKHIRKEVQGSAAIVISLTAEPALAEEIALPIARDAVNLLRFFSPGAPFLSTLCPTALVGADLVPGSTVLFLTAIGLSSMTSKTAATDIARWRMRVRDLSHLNQIGLPLAGKLVDSSDLTEFEAAVRASLITFSKGTTFTDPIDRLSHALAALEGVLLRHTMEPIEFNIADRASFILSPEAEEREAIKQNVRQAYRLRARHRASVLAPSEMQAAEAFVFRAYTVLMDTLGNTPNFSRRSDFVEAVDNLAVRRPA